MFRFPLKVNRFRDCLANSNCLMNHLISANTLPFCYQDNQVIELARDVLDGKEKHVSIELPICNEDRTFGATLSYEISKYDLSLCTSVTATNSLCACQ